MKRITLIICLLSLSLLLIQCGKKEARITTSSSEAIKFYEEGVKLAEKFYDEEAIEKFKQAINLDTMFVMAHYYLSRSYESLGILGSAKVSIEKAKHYSGLTTPREWSYVNAWDKMLDQNYVSAIKIYQNIFRDYPNDRHTLFVIGKTFFLMKNYEKAINSMKKLIELEPTYAPAYNQLGYIYKEMGKKEEAIAAFKTYAELAPDEANPYDSLGDMYRAQGDYDNAISEYKKALEAKPDFYTSYRNLGLSYFAAGMYDKAFTTYREFIKTFPEMERKRDAYQDLIHVSIARGQYHQALQFADSALAYSKTSFRKSSTIALKGQIYCIKDDCDEAMKQFNASFTIFPDAIWAREGRGLVFIKQQKYGDAVLEAEKLLSLIEKYGLEMYQSNYNALMGKIAMEQGFYDEAIMYFKDAMKFDVFDHVSNRYPLAKAYYLKKDYEKAVETCQQIIHYNKNHAVTHLLLSKIFTKLNKNELATAEYKKFIEIWKDADPDAPELKI